MRRRVLEELRATFRPEFLNRVDETIVFRRLRREDLLRITDKLLSELRGRFAEKGLALAVSPETAAWLTERGTDEKYGARPLRRAVQHSLEDAAAELLLDGRAVPGDTVTALVRGGALRLEVSRKEMNNEK